jgi:hypothetical protein
MRRAAPCFEICSTGIAFGYSYLQGLHLSQIDFQADGIIPKIEASSNIPPSQKKLLQNLSAFGFQQAAQKFYLVIHPGIRKQLQIASDANFWICRAKDNAVNPRMH